MKTRERRVRRMNKKENRAVFGRIREVFVPYEIYA